MWGGGNTGLFAKPAAPAAATAPAGQRMTQSQWLQHGHTDIQSQALVHQYRKLQRFLNLPGFPKESGRYVRQRIIELAAGQCVSSYRWDGGTQHGWNSSQHPMDSELLVHVLITFFDITVPPPVAGAMAPATMPAVGGGLGFPARGINGIGMGAGLFGQAAPSAAASKTGVFWRADDELCGFTSRHFARGGDQQRVKSDAVLLQQPGTVGGGASLQIPLGVASGSTTHNGSLEDDRRSRGNGRVPPRLSILSDDIEWVVAQGEHNAWEAIVLFVLQRAKRGGFLCGIDLRLELFSVFSNAMYAEGAAKVKKPDNPIISHGMLSVLHPWSQRLEDMRLEDVAGGN
jgi:hypothetical protein